MKEPNMLPPQHLAQKIKNLRKEAGITQSELAEEISSSEPYICNIENCNANFTYEKAKEIIDAIERLDDNRAVVSEFMSDPLPEIRPDTPITVVREYLQDHRVVVVVDKSGEVVGSVDRMDVVGQLHG